MNFTIINSEKTSLKERGYRFADNSQHIINYDALERIEAVKGEDYAEELMHLFLMEREPICKDEDGTLYYVLFEKIPDKNSDSAPEPVIWQEVAVASMMLFTIINSEKKPLEDRGYHFAEGSKRVTNYYALEQLSAQYGEEYVEELTKRFLKEQEPICMGEDGVFYQVLFQDVMGEDGKSLYQGVIWQEVSVMTIIKKHDLI